MSSLRQLAAAVVVVVVVLYSWLTGIPARTTEPQESDGHLSVVVVFLSIITLLKEKRETEREEAPSFCFSYSLIGSIG
jgi:hypothetical protein